MPSSSGTRNRNVPEMLWRVKSWKSDVFGSTSISARSVATSWPATPDTRTNTNDVAM
jgi:hypothetical protein